MVDKSVSILVIDLKESFPSYNFLKERGYTLIRSSSLNEAIPKLAVADILLMDKALYSQGPPKIRGEFLRQTKGIPRVILNNNKSFKGIKMWLEEPSHYLYKPFSEMELIYAIEKVRERASLKEKIEGLSHEIKKKEKELAFFEDIGKTLTSALELKDILNVIMEKMKKMIKAEAWSIIPVDEETKELVFEKSRGEKGRRVEKFRLKIGEGIAGWVAKEGIPLVIPDVSKDPRFFKEIGRSLQFKIRSILCVPIISKGKVLGVLEVVNKLRDEPFSKDDLDLLMKLMDHAAVAIERASLYQKMAELVITDDLTKLFNLRYLNRTLDIEVERSMRYGTSVSVIFMDLDYFKNVNDSYGHLMGSKVLTELAQILLKNLRGIDIVTRYGGDEFVVILPQTSPQAAYNIAERIRKAVAQFTFLKKEGISLKLTASFGVASYPEHAKTKEDIIRLADEAMYRVKDKTRNDVYMAVALNQVKD